MKKLLPLIILLIGFQYGCSQKNNGITIEKNEIGTKLLVNGNPLIINGINWDYFPIGKNYSYILWNESEETITKALDYEMTLFKAMGINTIRVYTGIPQKWITYIYEKHGIYTMLNHSFGRYGLTLEGNWVGNTDYADPRVHEMLLKEVTELASKYKNTPGLLLYLLGNENNYGLFWDGAETEDIPVVDRNSTQRARAMYKLFNEAVLAMKGIDNQYPIAICNGDLQFLDLIAEECKDIDIFGINIYRGLSFDNAFERVKNEFGKPVLFTEFGADAYNDSTQAEDQKAQAKYLLQNWREIYENAAGLGKAGNALGGFTFQSSDGWWKSGQTTNLDVHDNHASWSNGGYSHDYKPGRNNMNEEWFGICAKGTTDANGHYPLYPRLAYYVLKEVHKVNPYAKGTTISDVAKHLGTIDIEKIEMK